MEPLDLRKRSAFVIKPTTFVMPPFYEERTFWQKVGILATIPHEAVFRPKEFRCHCPLGMELVFVDSQIEMKAIINDKCHWERNDICLWLFYCIGICFTAEQLLAVFAVK